MARAEYWLAEGRCPRCLLHRPLAPGHPACGVCLGRLTRRIARRQAEARGEAPARIRRTRRPPPEAPPLSYLEQAKAIEARLLAERRARSPEVAP